MKAISIPKGENGILRVFVISRPITEMSQALMTQTRADLASELLGIGVAPGTIELFPLSDLSEYGLMRYLVDGHDVIEDQLIPDRARLEALDGYVLLVFSSAFEGEAMTLTPSPDLTLIGTYSELQANMQASAIQSEAAKPFSGIPETTPQIPPQGRAGSAMVVLGIVVLLVLALTWLLL